MAIIEEEAGKIDCYEICARKTEKSAFSNNKGRIQKKEPVREIKNMQTDVIGMVQKYIYMRSGVSLTNTQIHTL